MITQIEAKKIVSDMTLDLVNQQRAKGAVATWNQKFHNLMLSKCVVKVFFDAVDKTDEVALKRDMMMVMEMGCGGNCSQYRQRLEKDKVIAKGDRLEEEYQ